MRLFKHLALRAAPPPSRNPLYSAGTEEASIAPDQPLSGKGRQMAEVLEKRLDDYRITSLRTFKEATEEPRQIAGLYFYQILDCLVDLAYKVSADFRKRPELYRVLGPIVETLAELNAKYGTEVNFLSAAERNEIYLPIFGNADGSSSSGNSSFALLRTDLVRAATIFAEGAVDHGVPMLREGVLTAHRPFRDYLLGLQGDSVRFSKDKALSQLTEDICYKILRNQNIARVFGVTAEISGEDYPYDTDFAEDLLIEKIAGQLTWRTDSAYLMPTRERISNLQNVALRGAEAIATAIDFDDKRPTPDDFDRLITKCYSWGTALTSLNGQSKGLPSPTQPTPSTSMVARPATASPTTAAVFGQR
jgi:hypothetical protein